MKYTKKCVYGALNDHNAKKKNICGVNNYITLERTTNEKMVKIERELTLINSYIA